MPDTLESLQQRLEEQYKNNKAITDLADAEKRDLSSDELDDLDAGNAEFAALERQIKLRKDNQAQAQALTTSTRRSEPQEPHTSAEWGEDDETTKREANYSRRLAAPLNHETKRFAGSKTAGFRSPGEFLQAVFKDRVLGTRDPRLQSLAATTYANEASGADGGFAVPPDFRAEILKEVIGEGSLASLCDQQVTSSNAMSFPKDETTPWGTSNAITAYWDSEAGTMTQQKTFLGAETIKLNKLTAMVNVTDELLEDAPALTGYISRKVPEVINFKLNLAIVQGSGAGQPLGIIASPCLVTQAAEAGQTSDTLTHPNVAKMYSRLYGPWRPNAIWLMNQDVEPQLLLMQNIVYSTTTPVGGSAVYLTGGSVASAPYDTLYGKRIFPTQACATLGDVGDVIFADMQQYLFLMKSGGLKQDTSIHIYFDQNVSAFRFTMRVGGQPRWATTIAARSGSGTYSGFVALAAR